jgi:transposase InsO family protein
VTDITYIRAQEGWLFLAVIIDLFSRRVISVSMRGHINTDLVFSAITMACWRRKPKGEVIVHSDPGCQYTSYDWQSILKANNLVVSMSRRGNCHDNACAEIFFALLKENVFVIKFIAAERKVKPMYLIILSCSIIPPGIMKIIMTCRQWNVKSTTF